jgi:MFS family permease
VTRLKIATRETFRSFRVRNFRVFFVGQAISQIGTWLQFIAQALLVLQLTDSGIALGLVTAFQFLPVLVFGAWAGVISDRVDKRRLMLVTQTLMMLFALVLGVFVLSGHITVIGVYVLAALTGTANAFDNPSRRVMITELVGDAEMANAVSLNSALITGARVVGPALAAWLIHGVGIGWCFIANAASFVAMLVALLMIDPATLHATERVTKQKGQIVEGFRYVWAHEELRLAVLMMGVVATLSFNWQVLLPLLAEHDFHGNENTYAFITTVFSIGSLAGSLLIARRTTMDNRFLARASIGLGVASLLMALAPNPLTAALIGSLAGAAGIAFLSATMTALQLHSIPVMRGRVMALYSILFLGSTPIGGPLAGWIAQVFGTRWSIGLGAVAALTSGFAGLAVLKRRAEASDDQRLEEPALTVMEAAA